VTDVTNCSRNVGEKPAHSEHANTGLACLNRCTCVTPRALQCYKMLILFAAAPAMQASVGVVRSVPAQHVGRVAGLEGAHFSGKGSTAPGHIACICAWDRSRA
jgi:hypothetical protein